MILNLDHEVKTAFSIQERNCLHREGEHVGLYFRLQGTFDFLYHFLSPHMAFNLNRNLLKAFAQCNIPVPDLTTADWKCPQWERDFRQI